MKPKSVKPSELRVSRSLVLLWYVMVDMAKASKTPGWQCHGFIGTVQVHKCDGRPRFAKTPDILPKTATKQAQR